MKLKKTIKWVLCCIVISLFVYILIEINEQLYILEKRIRLLKNDVEEINEHIGNWDGNSIKLRIEELEYDIEELKNGFEILDGNVYRNHQRLNDIEWE